MKPERVRGVCFAIMYRSFCVRVVIKFSPALPGPLPEPSGSGSGGERKKKRNESGIFGFSRKWSGGVSSDEAAGVQGAAPPGRALVSSAVRRNSGAAGQRSASCGSFAFAERKPRTPPGKKGAPVPKNLLGRERLHASWCHPSSRPCESFIKIFNRPE